MRWYTFQPTCLWIKWRYSHHYKTSLIGSINENTFFFVARLGWTYNDLVGPFGEMGCIECGALTVKNKTKVYDKYRKILIKPFFNTFFLLIKIYESTSISLDKMCFEAAIWTKIIVDYHSQKFIYKVKHEFNFNFFVFFIK